MTDIGGLVRSVNPVVQGQSPLAADELDALLVLINEKNNETGIEGLTRRVEPTKPRRRGWQVAAAAAVAVVLVLGPVLLFGGETEPNVRVTEPEVATTAPPTTALQATPLPDGEKSPRVPQLETVLRRVELTSVTAGGPGFVAVGTQSVLYDSAPDAAAVWTSTDGTTWSRVPDDDAVFGGSEVTSVIPGGPGLVAIGTETNVSRPDEPNAVVWTSIDGITWSRVPHDETVFGGEGEQRMVSVTVGGPGLVAVGFDRPADDGEGGAAVWTSIDGITWSRVPHDDAVFGNSGMSAVTAGGPGLVAVGDHQVWTSPDGTNWSRVAHDESVFGSGDLSMEDVTAGGPGLVAIGNWPGGAVIWTSIDGTNWSRVAHDESVFGGSGDQSENTWRLWMEDVTAGGPGLVAVGNGPGGAVIWTSIDGTTWSRVRADDTIYSGFVRAVAVGGPGLVAVGQALYPHTGGFAPVWTSTDGVTWARLPDDKGVFDHPDMSE